MAKPDCQSVVFFHPDLGIGGAERLVIDAAVGLQNLGHKVTIFTSHCDPKHCFDEARDGSLSKCLLYEGTLDVRVYGNSIVPPSILGRFSIFCAILRQLHLILQIALFSTELSRLRPTVFFVDQLSAGIPVLRILSPSPRVIFYCHFPDKLLARRGGFLKTLYRGPFDWLERWSTGCSDSIVVNSIFTKNIFSQAFPELKHRSPKVIYPCVDTKTLGSDQGRNDQLWENKKIVLSINRFERKKDVGLAIRAFSKLSDEERKGARLVIAGGYDSRVTENVTYHQDLCNLAGTLGLQHATHKTTISALAISAEIDVLFLLSIPNTFKATLLSTARLLIYTPLHEHFGIVPLEAMLAKTPVLAANEGGPTETVVDGQTGWLRDVSIISDWSDVMRFAIDIKNHEQIEEMGRTGQQRVIREFSKEKMAKRLDNELMSMLNGERAPMSLGPISLLACGFLGIMITAAWTLLWTFWRTKS